MRAQTLVVGYDGSNDARRALDAAMAHVSDDGIVHVVTAFDPPSRAELDRVLRKLPPEFQNSASLEETPRGYLRDAEAQLERAGIRHEGHFVDGHPAAAILDVADAVGADLIVIGTRGLGRVDRFLRGSVSARIANHARTSLMMIHHDEAAA
ncbi:MAG: universal stress protein [Ilumatobacteraceae bacterium]|nr:universal stress protein [Ilumatobacteraceae bacterium]